MISKGIYTKLATLPTIDAHNEIIMKVRARGWNKKKQEAMNSITFPSFNSSSL